MTAPASVAFEEASSAEASFAEVSREALAGEAAAVHADDPSSGQQVRPSGKANASFGHCWNGELSCS